MRTWKTFCSKCRSFNLSCCSYFLHVFCKLYICSRL
jgi:hypothetical protein